MPDDADGLVPALPQLSDRVELRTRHVRAGQSMTGTLVITSTASGPINLTKQCEPSLQVVIGNRSVRQQPAFDAMCTNHPLRIYPGTNRFPITVTTRYFACTQPGGSSAPSLPACGADGPPPLPPGRYRTILVGSGNLPLPEPPSVSVELT